MRVLNVAHGADTGGWGTRLKQAFAKYAPDIQYDATAASAKYFDYPVDMSWVLAKQVWLAADVVHLRNGFEAIRKLRVQPKPTVVQYHGSRFRRHHGWILPEQQKQRARGIVSTLDLWLIAPDDVTWVPSPFNEAWLKSFVHERSVDDVLRVAHAPTNRRVKSTDAFLAAIEKLREQIQVELVLIENRRWQDCLRLKATADVYYDQVGLGYGNNAVEAWGMGIPVVCGAQDATLAEYERRFGSLPFVLADEGSIYQALLYLAAKPNREQWGRCGLQHMRQWHSEEPVVAQMRAIYEEVAGCVTPAGRANGVASPVGCVLSSSSEIQSVESVA